MKVLGAVGFLGAIWLTVDAYHAAQDLQRPRPAPTVTVTRTTLPSETDKVPEWTGSSGDPDPRCFVPRGKKAPKHCETSAAIP